MDYQITPLLPPHGQHAGRQITVRPDLTVLDLAARYHLGSFAFPALLTANGVIDGIPFLDAPPRHLRKMSVYVGQEITVPDGGIG